MRSLSLFDGPAAWRRWRSGVPLAVAAAALLAAAAWLHAVTLPALAAATRGAEAALAQALQRADARRPAAGAAVDARPPALRFAAAFAPAAERHARLAALLALARSHGLAVPRTEARWIEAAPLARYELSMAVQGDYARWRGFVSDALAADAALSLDALTLRRADAGSPAVEADMRWSLYLRSEAGR